MKSNKKVLALKYRPQVFQDLIGQEIVSETIFNSIVNKKTANAYLFTGIRGVGKTTIARILAKSLNCENGIENLCQENYCQHCNSIINSNHIDVLEMDAASKTGVDDVRDLIDFSRYGPTSAKYKIFIIDEVHMLSKQAFNALLKTLEEPPDYLKFIFATTEVKKIPVTVLSRCQRFDLPRIKSEILFEFIKKITRLENKKASDEALKLIVKISEGSVRDALSLLDRGLMSKADEEELDILKARKIFGFFDKSTLLELFENILKGDQQQTLNIYKKIYQAGVEPKIFLNDFLEILYYIKNISSIKLEGTNFSLNDQEFEKINKISSEINPDDIMLFWHFTIKTIDELEIVLNPNLSIEMFLIRLMHLKGMKQKNTSEIVGKKDIYQNKINQDVTNLSGKMVNQIKNVSQQDKPILKTKSLNETNNFKIETFENLIELCNEKKEIKIKYELENNVNLVSFSEGIIEIALNQKLEKNFIKELSNKLFEWTNKRWIISLSKNEGALSKKEEEKINKEKIFKDIKKTEIYKKVIETFSDAELVDVKFKEDQND